ncbi:hypothetical protein ACQZV8_19455, partial [Magnetococcales bacterium HHB-1]
MTVLVFSEIFGGVLQPATRRVLKAAGHLSDDVVLITFAEPGSSMTDPCQYWEGVDRIIHLEHARFFQPLVEDLVEAMAQLLRDSEKMGLSSISHVLFPGTFFGRDIMARLAARFNSESFTDIREIIDANHVSRAVFAGNILLSLKLDH